MSSIEGRERNKVKNKNIGAGIILILLGIFWMLENLGFITWSLWDGINDLWPLVFVIIGVNIIFKKNAFVPMITWILFFLILIGYGFFQGQRLGQLSPINGGNVQITKETGASRGVLDLDFGAGNVFIGNTKEFLVDANVPNAYIQNKVSHRDGGKTVDVQFKEKKHRFIIQRKDRDYHFRLNEDMLWDIDMDMGAANGTVDFSQLNVKDIDIDAGAVDLELVFGNIIEMANVKIDAGAANINMTIPDTVGVKVKLDGALKDSNLKELGWNNQEGVYLSPNYEDAEKKINIDMDMGAGSLDVHIQ
ncbi:MAG: hypothetical protein K0R93_2859 [Anaerosolibacter sp.]|jgi:hypothetical protein|uniref:LiaI-LiaF-like domain-containing protein n=1 Tax=Anaerosolibacter sp. TaxID=1872527 RepID=UPI00260DA855|nr:DUF5668 domain-containing protein [Anaerosolibacter sp.]MDF2547961.1 hypothetical protein [Anaerosolibacter sp.]